MILDYAAQFKLKSEQNIKDTIDVIQNLPEHIEHTRKKLIERIRRLEHRIRLMIQQHYQRQQQRREMQEKERKLRLANTAEHLFSAAEIMKKSTSTIHSRHVSGEFDSKDDQTTQDLLAVPESLENLLNSPHCRSSSNSKTTYDLAIDPGLSVAMVPVPALSSPRPNGTDISSLYSRLEQLKAQFAQLDVLDDSRNTNLSVSSTASCLDTQDDVSKQPNIDNTFPASSSSVVKQLDFTLSRATPTPEEHIHSMLTTSDYDVSSTIDSVAVHAAKATPKLMQLSSAMVAESVLSSTNNIVTSSVAPPPPPLDTQINFLHSIPKSRPVLKEKNSNVSSESLRSLPDQEDCTNTSNLVQTSTQLTDLQAALLGSKVRLRSTALERSPGGTPRRLQNSNSNPLAVSLFNKFKKARGLDGNGRPSINPHDEVWEP